MSVNGITGNTLADVYASYTATSKNGEKNAKVAEEPGSSTSAAAVYEPSENTSTAEKAKGANAALAAQLKADQENRINQLKDLVAQMMNKQAGTAGLADDMWKFLAKGDFEVDEETRAKAQEDISEDGYWGVKETSNRILDFAVALAGTDTDALEKMRDAFEKGFAQAEETWGGELPEICQQTYSAVLQKFDELLNQNGTQAASADADPTQTVQ
ncbi:MAG: hypothetical protein K5682_10400 [Lachnospiraceae bacterium]|nr:hypothetical protein [Lachnospiraceae bacterium]